MIQMRRRETEESNYVPEIQIERAEGRLNHSIRSWFCELNQAHYQIRKVNRRPIEPAGLLRFKRLLVYEKKKKEISFAKKEIKHETSKTKGNSEQPTSVS